MLSRFPGLEASKNAIRVMGQAPGEVIGAIGGAGTRKGGLGSWGGKHQVSWLGRLGLSGEIVYTEHSAGAERHGSALPPP